MEITVRRSKGDGFICDYVNDALKVGDVLTGTMGLGQFYYEPLRDARHVVALAGGVGITPFASMAKEVVNGTLDIDLTILYGSVSSDDIVMKEELDALIRQGRLFSDDPYEALVPKVMANKTVVKALCLNVAHDCNLACRYCFASEGEYHGKSGQTGCACKARAL